MQTRRSRDEQNKLSQRQRTGCFQLGEFTFCYNECSAESSLDEVHDPETRRHSRFCVCPTLRAAVRSWQGARKLEFLEQVIVLRPCTATDPEFCC